MYISIYKKKKKVYIAKKILEKGYLNIRSITWLFVYKYTYT